MGDVRVNSAALGPVDKIPVKSLEGLETSSGPYLLSDGKSLMDPLPVVLAAGGTYLGIDGKLRAAVSLGNSTYVEDALVAAQIAAMAVAPTSGQRMTVDTLFKDLRQWNLLGKLDRLYTLHSHDAQASRLNCMVPGELLGASNSPTFTPFLGWNGNGATSFLQQPGPYGFAGGKFVQDSASIGVGIAATSGSGLRATFGTAAGDISRLSINTGTSLTSTRVNDSAALSVAANLHGSSRLGSFMVSRTGPNARAIFHNGAQITADTTVSSAPSVSVGLLGRGGGAYSADTYWYYFSGSGLTAADAANLNAALNAYRAAYVA